MCSDRSLIVYWPPLRIRTRTAWFKIISGDHYTTTAHNDDCSLELCSATLSVTSPRICHIALKIFYDDNTREWFGTVGLITLHLYESCILAWVYCYTATVYIVQILRNLLTYLRDRWHFLFFYFYFTFTHLPTRHCLFLFWRVGPR